MRLGNQSQTESPNYLPSITPPYLLPDLLQQTNSLLQARVMSQSANNLIKFLHTFSTKF